MTVRNRFYPDQEQPHPYPPKGGGNPVLFLSDFYFIDFNLKNLLSLYGNKKSANKGLPL